MTGLSVASQSVNEATPLRATVTLRNTSGVAGAEVVQLYTHQRAGSTARPVRELKAFEKVTLGPGETKQVELTVPAEELSYWAPLTYGWASIRPRLITRPLR